MTSIQKDIAFGLGATAITLLIAVAFFRNSKRNTTKIIVDYSKFDSPDSIGSGSCIDPNLVRMLNRLAKQTGLPLFDWITSGVRTPYWNRKVGGASRSSHLIPVCKAVDIGVPNKAIRDLLVVAARQIGFKRIGVGNTFVHLDIDPLKPQYVAWGYPKGNRPEINPFV